MQHEYPTAFVKDDAERIAYTATDAVNLRAQGFVHRPDAEAGPELDIARENTGQTAPPPPPLGGPGSGAKEWREHAQLLDVDIDGLDKREDIIAAIAKAGHPTETPPASS